MSSDYEICTARSIFLRKFEKSVRQTNSADSDVAWWARDCQQQVTRTMTPQSPYDRTTPPTSPPLNFAHRLYVPTSHRIDPRDAQPAVWQWPPHPAPGGYGIQDDLHHAFTRDAYGPSIPPTIPQVRNRLNVYCPRPQSNTQPRSIDPNWTAPRFERESPIFITPAMLTTAMHMPVGFESSPRSSLRSSTESIPPRKLSATAQVAEWAARMVRKKRRPSEIFNMNFSFDAASSRSSSNRSPQISPRTSFSSGSMVAKSPEEAHVKRQRIDSTGSNMDEGYPFNNPTSRKTTGSNNLSSPIVLPRGSSPSRNTPPLFLHTTTGEVHPGRLVDFSSPSTASHDPSNDPFFTPPSTTSAFHLRLPPSTSRFPPHRRASLPTPARPLHTIRTTHRMLARLTALTAEANTHASLNLSRKRTYTLERRERTKRKAPPESLAGVEIEQVQDFEKKDGAKALRRTVSAPCTEAFLEHVRASLVRRKEREGRMDYPVFVDEMERGFLDDEPL